MANIKQQKKRNRQNEARRLRNRAVRGVTRSALKNARLAIEKGIEANISYASTKGISGKAFGTILLSVSGDENIVKETIDYLTQEPGIEAEEVEVNVQ